MLRALTAYNGDVTGEDATNRGGALAAALALAWSGTLGCGGPDAPAEMRATELVWFTSADAVTWEAQPDVLATGFNALGLSVRDGGQVWVSGVDHTRPGHPPLRPRRPRVAGLVYDGEAWSARDWILDGPEPADAIDPQWFGDELWYVAFSGEGDPAHATAPNQVRSLPGPVVRHEAVGLVDPSPVRFRDRLIVFANVWGRGVVQLEGDPLREVRSWDGVSVPFATVVGDELWLLAQAEIGGRRQPVLARSTDGERFGDWTPLIDGQVERSCTSPVLAALEDGYLLLCVVETW